MADAVSIPNPAQDREDRYVAGLRRELVAHEQRDNPERAEQVRAELKRLGRHEDPEKDARDRELADDTPDAEPRTADPSAPAEKAVPRTRRSG